MMAEAHEMAGLECSSHEAHMGHAGIDARAHCGDHGSVEHNNPQDTSPDLCCEAAFGAFISDTVVRTRVTEQKNAFLALEDLEFQRLPAYPKFQSSPFLDLGPSPFTTPPLRILYAQFLN